jgi:hypothetical protein
MKLAVIGSRTVTDSETVFPIIAEYNPSQIVSGGARGADQIGKDYAEKIGLPAIIFPAEWKKHGKKAGYIRNHDIIKNCDHVVAFWDGESRGTLHSIGLAKDTYHKPCDVYIFHDGQWSLTDV